MLNRRLLRIKAFKVLFSTWQDGPAALEPARKELLRSCEKTLDLYYFLLNVCGSLRQVAFDKIEAARNKFHPTEEERNPNMKFVNNRFFAAVEDNAEFQKYCSRKGLLWGDYDIFVRKLFASVTASDYYKEYMESGTDSFKADCAFARRLFEEEFEDNASLEAILEDLSSYWIDDVNYVLNNILYSIDNMIAGRPLILPDVFIKDEDRDFVLKLLEVSLVHYDEYFQLVCNSLDNWDSDRLVSTDATLIVMGIAEAVWFDNIPTKVTINEYVEISKYYSTANSRMFVNGLLDKIIQAKVASGEIVKTGRGLLDGGQRVSKEQ
ncbi:MAG: transcription antitermination protein NusB [Bacteroidales bacterium]|nr:transcription antitermination protein NusB [Bacteroidales bacterium]